MVNKLFKIDKSLTKPMYQQIIDSVIDQIRHGQLGYKDSLPSEENCQMIYGVSSVIIKRAYGELQKMGYITRKQGRGTEISYLPELALGMSDLPNLSHIHPQLNIELILKEKNSQKSFEYSYKFIFKIGNLVIAQQEFLSSYEYHGASPTIYNVLISRLTLKTNNNLIEAKKADASLAFILGIEEGDAVISIQNASPTSCVNTYLRGDLFTLLANAHEN